MERNFLNKAIWSDEDWEIYFHNLDLIRIKNRLSKGNFNRQLSIGNVFRKFKSRPTQETILRICKNFDVTEEWLGSKHYPDIEPAAGPLHVAEIKPDYEPYGGWEPQTKAEDWGLMGMTHRVLTSQSIYSQALGANIRAFHHALQAEIKAIEQDEKIKEQKQTIDALIAQNKELNEKCDNLTKRIERLESKLTNDLVQNSA